MGVFVSICACGHPWPSHTIRQIGIEHTRTLMARGESICRHCFCPGYVDAVDVEDRTPFRVTQKAERGNCGVSHPLRAALAKTDQDVRWHSLECAGCKVALTPQSALVLDSAFYCGPCFIQRPEVYCGFVQESEAG